MKKEIHNVVKSLSYKMEHFPERYEKVAFKKCKRCKRSKPVLDFIIKDAKGHKTESNYCFKCDMEIEEYSQCRIKIKPNKMSTNAIGRLKKERI